MGVLRFNDGNVGVFSIDLKTDNVFVMRLFLSEHEKCYGLADMENVVWYVDKSQLREV